MTVLLNLLGECSCFALLFFFLITASCEFVGILVHVLQPEESQLVYLP